MNPPATSPGRSRGAPPVVDTSEWGAGGRAAVRRPAGLLWRTESAQDVGRAVARLAADPRVPERSGRVLLVGDLAREYGFTDLDGGQPHYQDEAPRWKRRGSARSLGRVCARGSQHG